jgi:hypothetical protein
MESAERFIVIIVGYYNTCAEISKASIYTNGTCVLNSIDRNYIF